MGRKDTITAKNIRKMYEQLRLDQNDILHRTTLMSIHQKLRLEREKCQCSVL